MRAGEFLVTGRVLVCTDRLPGERSQLAFDDGHLGVLQLAPEALDRFQGRVDLQGPARFMGLV